MRSVTHSLKFSFIGCILATVFTPIISPSNGEHFSMIWPCLLQTLCVLSLALTGSVIDTSSSLVIGICNGISLRLDERISFLSTMIWTLTVMIPDLPPSLRSAIVVWSIMISTVHLGVSSFSITVDTGLESSVSIKWSHLPPDLAREIVDRMTSYKDNIAAIGVCRHWRSAFSSNSFRLPLPALLLSEPLSTDMRILFSLDDYSRHRLKLPEVLDKRIWGSQHGWVATLGSHYGTQLVHLMKGKRINLPQIQRPAPQEEWFCLVHKFSLLKDPTDESTFLVLAIFGPMNSLAFTRVREEEGPALNRIGEGEWVVVANPETLKFKDVAHFNGQIYALCDNGKLVRLEADAPLADMVQVIADHPQDVGAHRKVYLVESLGNLYGVFRNGFLIPSERRFETTSFFVYKFNLNASAWEEVTHLEGQAFFVGDGNSFSWRFPTSTIPRRSNCIYFTWLFRTSTIPSRSNCIYFTDDQWDWQMYPRILAFGGHDVGVFDMASRAIQRLAFGIGKDEPCFYSRPIWVTRSHKLI